MDSIYEFPFKYKRVYYKEKEQKEEKFIVSVLIN